MIRKSRIRKAHNKIASLLVIVLTLSMLAACSSNNSAGDENGNIPADSDGFAKGKFEPAVEISTYQCNNNLTYRDGESIQDNVHTRWAKEELGIQIKYDWVTSGDQCANKIRLALAGNQKLPDVMTIGDYQMLGDLIESGKIMDISEAFDKYASDQVKAIYGQDPSYWFGVSKDGAKYGIPTLNESMNNDPLLYIRQDWLDQIGMQAPTNFDELEKVMDAMLQADFNGNGKKDAPLALGLKNDLNPFATYMTDASWIFGGYGSIPGYWNTWNDENTLEYGSIQPEVKEALAKMQEWFTKGYISEDIGLLDERKGSEQFTSEKSGIIAGPTWMYSWPIQASLMKNNSDAKVTPIKIPAGPSGKAGRHGTTIPGPIIVFNKDFKHIDAFMLYFNKLYEYNNPAKGSPYENGWHEGYDYVMKDGKVSRERADFPNETPIDVSKYFMMEGVKLVDPHLSLEIRRKLYNGEAPSTPQEHQWYNMATKEERANPKSNKSWQAVDIVLQQQDSSILDMYLGPPTKTMVNKSEALRTLEHETFMSIIYGKAPISEFDTFVEKWKKSGGDEITAEINEWFQQVNNK
ncbi:extracellular solute-binding protein [Paenibacillus lautus]|uniref:extracellular solute-binding protein n=1 Tax=Paenibacillus lautus TaxID=1401 RepID=UPI001C11D95B|nr:extracellular solute-binding protein [Paenibacillus lautus]MBU5348311.1 extracellular solute-binding protein [Paenibacillus lautus]